MTSDTAIVPLGERWRGAKLQAKADAEDGKPPDEWADAPMRWWTALGFWAYMLRWPPTTNGSGVIVASRTRLGRGPTLVVLIVGIATVVGVFRRWPWVGAALAILAFPIAVGTLAHVIGTWRTPGPTVTYLANFIRHPSAAKGSALPLFAAVCVDADRNHHALALHTRRTRLIPMPEKPPA